jgi:hypothetical protein
VVKPLFKKGDNKDIKNYRHILLLTSFSEMFEKMIYIRLSEHIILYYIILSNEQFEFRNNSSTGNTTFKHLNDILQALKIRSLWEVFFVTLRRPLTVLIIIY